MYILREGFSASILTLVFFLPQAVTAQERQVRNCVDTHLHNIATSETKASDVIDIDYMRITLLGRAHSSRLSPTQWAEVRTEIAKYLDRRFGQVRGDILGSVITEVTEMSLRRFGYIIKGKL